MIALAIISACFMVNAGLSKLFWMWSIVRKNHRIEWERYRRGKMKMRYLESLYLMPEYLHPPKSKTYETAEGIIYCSLCGSALSESEIEAGECGCCWQIENGDLSNSSPMS